MSLIHTDPSQRLQTDAILHILGNRLNLHDMSYMIDSVHHRSSVLGFDDLMVLEKTFEIRLTRKRSTAPPIEETYSSIQILL